MGMGTGASAGAGTGLALGGCAASPSVAAERTGSPRVYYIDFCPAPDIAVFGSLPATLPIHMLLVASVASTPPRSADALQSGPTEPAAVNLSLIHI